jgi:hypothetical protein
MIDKNHLRACALELQDAIQTLYIAGLPLYRSVFKWRLNQTDAYLPQAVSVKSALAGYDALKKTALQLTTWLAEIRASTEVMPECLVYGIEIPVIYTLSPLIVY